MTISTIFLGAIVGAVAGSTATALAERYHNLPRFLIGRSHCSHCRRPLGAFELIPIVSWLALRGRCRSCGAPIGWGPLLVEVAAAILGAWFASRYGPGLLWLWFWWLLVVLGALALVDLDSQELPDRLLALALPAVGLIGLALPSLSLAPLNLVTGALVETGIVGGLYLGTRGKGMGFGDVKLAAVLGAGLGVSQGLVALFLAFTAGGLVAGWQLISGRATVGARIALGPFLIVGYLATLFLGPHLVAWYSGY